MKIRESIILLVYASLIFFGLATLFDYLELIKDGLDGMFNSTLWLGLVISFVFSIIEYLIYDKLFKAKGRTCLILTLSIVYFLVFFVVVDFKLQYEDYIFYLLNISLQNVIICYSIYYQKNIMSKKE